MITLKYAKYRPHGGYFRLSGNKFIVDTDKYTGVLKGLYHRNDPFETNFLGNEINMRVKIGKQQKVFCWTGDLFIKRRSKGSSEWKSAYTCLSGDVRRVYAEGEKIVVSYEGESSSPGGIRNLKVKETFRLEDESLIWEIEVINACPSAVQIGELALPFILNTNYALGDFEHGWNHRSTDGARTVFEKRVVGHYFVSGHSSYVYAERPNGDPPYLLIMPLDETFFEAVVGDYYQGGHVETNLVRATGPVIYLYSDASRELDGWKTWYNGHRVFQLLPGEGRRFSVKFCWAKDYDDIDQKLYENGKVAVRVSPGMVLPRKTKANLLMRCNKPITELESSHDVHIEEITGEGDSHVYEVHLETVGEHTVTVKYGKDEWVNLIFYGIEDIESLIQMRSRFILDKQRVTSPRDIRRHAFLMWDNVTDSLITHVPYHEPTETKGDAWMSGCSDECGFAEPLFLSGKNVYYPNRQEIKILEDYIEEFLWGKLQDRESFQVLRSISRSMWGSSPGVWRGYNYPHVYNIYYNMYRISKLYRATKWPAKRYLEMAYRTAMASFSDQTYAGITEDKNFGEWWEGNWSRSMGFIGSWNLINIMQALKNESMMREHRALEGEVEISLQHLLSEEYPYATEFPYDPPSFEPAFYFGKYANSKSLVDRTVKAILATRHRQPAWFLYGCDIKGCGNYTTPLNGRCLLDAFE